MCNLRYFVVRQFVSQIYAVLSRGNFCQIYALLSVKFAGLTMCQCKKSDIAKEVATITKEVDTVDKEVDTITKEVTTIVKEIDTIAKEVATITKEVATVTEEVDTITKVYFPKVYFLKVCTSKIYFPKVYFCEMYPTCVSS